MRMVKVSATLSGPWVAEAKSRVGERGFSHYLDTALARQLQADRLLDLEREFAAEFGPIPEPAQAAVDALEWPR